MTEEELLKRADVVAEQFKEKFLQEVKRLRLSGAVDTDKVDHKFLEAVFLITAENNFQGYKTDKEYKNMLKNLRCF